MTGEVNKETAQNEAMSALDKAGETREQRDKIHKILKNMDAHDKAEEEARNPEQRKLLWYLLGIVSMIVMIILIMKFV